MYVDIRSAHAYFPLLVPVIIQNTDVMAVWSADWLHTSVLFTVCENYQQNMRVHCLRDPESCLKYLYTLEPCCSSTWVVVETTYYASLFDNPVCKVNPTDTHNPFTKRSIHFFHFTYSCLFLISAGLDLFVLFSWDIFAFSRSLLCPGSICP